MLRDSGVKIVEVADVYNAVLYLSPGEAAVLDNGSDRFIIIKVDAIEAVFGEVRVHIVGTT